MSSSIHAALRHRTTLPSWLVATMLAVVIAIAAVALFADAGGSSPGVTPAKASTAPAPTLPTTCIDNRVVGHC
jgi:hypothetical protein